MEKCSVGRKPMKEEDVIKRFKELYGDKFDYSLFKYIDSKTKGEIKCNTCGTIFKQRPDLHLAGSGCTNCTKKYIIELKEISQQDVIKRFIEIHGNKYDYSKVIYINSLTKVCVTCLTDNHGDYWITPNSHLKGHGCPKCGSIKQAVSKTLDQKEVIERFKNIHGDKFGYDYFIYKGMKKKGKIECFEHGIFLQSADNHLKGHGCPKCASIRQAVSKTLDQKVFYKDITEILKIINSDKFICNSLVYKSTSEK